MKSVRYAAGVVAGLVPLAAVPVTAGPAAAQPVAAGPARTAAGTGTHIALGARGKRVSAQLRMSPDENHNACAGTTSFFGAVNKNDQFLTGWYTASLQLQDVCIGTLDEWWEHVPATLTGPTSVRFRIRSEPGNNIISHSTVGFHTVTDDDGLMLWVGSAKFRSWYAAPVMACGQWLYDGQPDGSANCFTWTPG